MIHSIPAGPVTVGDEGQTRVCATGRRVRRQRYAGQSRTVAILSDRGALDPELQFSDAADIAYTALSPDVHRILTVERGWPADRYERWIARSLATLLPAGQRPPAKPAT